MIMTKHALLRAQQRAISPIMAILIDEYGITWQSNHDRDVSALKPGASALLAHDAKQLIREAKAFIKVLKRIEKKGSSRDTNMQVVSHEGALITQANSQRCKKRGYK